MSIGNFEVNIQDLLNAGNKGEVRKLEEGQYDSVVVGYLTRTITDTITKEVRDVFELIFQVVDGDQKHYVRSKDFKLSLNEKSGYFDKFVKKLTKVATPADPQLIPRLKSLGIVSSDNKVKLENHFGLSVKLTLEDVVARNGKSYIQIVSYGPSKVAVEIVPDSIPEALLMWDVANKVTLADGLTIKPRAVKAPTETQTTPTATPEAKEVTPDNSWLDS